MHIGFSRPGFASGQIKMLLAGVLAIAGVALAVRALLPTRSERTDQPKPRVVTADGSVPVPERHERAAPDPAAFGWIEDANRASYEFRRVSNASDARKLADAIGGAVDASGNAADGLGADLVGLLAPSIAGEGSVRDAVVALGGEDHDSIPVLDVILQTVLKHASADPLAITVSTPTGQPVALGAISVNRNRATDVDPDGNEIERETISLSSSFERTFPGALADGASGPLRTVEIPMRSKNTKGDQPDMRLALTLRYNAKARAWQPATMTIDSTDTDMLRRVMDEIRKVRSFTPATGREGGN